MGYDFIDPNPQIKAIYAKEKQTFMPHGVIGFSTDAVSIETTVKRLAKLPMHHLPGKEFTYAVGLDVLGYLIEIISQRPLDQYFQEAIFDPLEMHDTHFYLPEEKASRLVPVLTKKEGQWALYETDLYDINYPIQGAKQFFSGGGGLSSTVDDYFNFLSLFVNHGRFKDQQILGKMTVDLLFKDQIGGHLKADYFNMGQGLAFGVVREQEYIKGGLGSVGTGYWGGYFNTGYFVDPQEKLIGIIYKQTLDVSENSTDLFNRLIFSAVVR
jgi:CubicO group peptidase (beta-lactamase class C family)